MFGGCKPETVVALTAVVAGLLSEMLSGDMVALAMYRAEAMALESGVSPEEFAMVKAKMIGYWARKKAGNPLGGMF